MSKIKISYSILSMVEKGYIDEAIAMWQGKDLPSTPPMELGEKWHKVWEAHIKSTHTLPPELGDGLLEDDIKVEQKIRRDFKLGEHEVTLSGILDLWRPSTKTGSDWKCGKTKTSNFANSHQHEVYSLLIPEMEHFEYRAWNPYTKERQTAIIHITDQVRNRGREFVETWTSEFIGQLNYIGVLA